jgi:predicted O-methyltransferase YrrM
MKIHFRPFDKDSSSPLSYSLAHPLYNIIGLRGAISQHSIKEDELLKKFVGSSKTIVEIGVAEAVCGYSIRSVMDENAVMYLIDPYIPGKIPGLNLQYVVAKKIVNSVKRGKVEWIKEFSHDAFKTWGNKKIDFLFIDGDHSYEGCLQDWEDWSKYVPVGGIVVFHDARVFAGGWVEENWGPVQVVNKVFRSEPNKEWEIVEEADSMVVVRRTQL